MVYNIREIINLIQCFTIEYSFINDSFFIYFHDSNTYLCEIEYYSYRESIMISLGRFRYSYQHLSASEKDEVKKYIENRFSIKITDII